ncbi:MAG: hypothetical protein EOP06_18145 [Proteobacteria bacterium]|nr:MAG: hypothetical protein EOP06_18145 [Pseudomonadota bacterium]
MKEEAEVNHSFSLPLEWALKKVLGPTLETVGKDIQGLYEVGRDMIIRSAENKVSEEDGKTANLRVTRDVFWNGSYSNDEISAEYFGGVLASSRSDDGSDDSMVPIAETIKALSSGQLKLHYLIYRSLNELFVGRGIFLDVGRVSLMSTVKIWFFRSELEPLISSDFRTSLTILIRHGLIRSFDLKAHHEFGAIVMVVPTSYGIITYAAAHNRFSEWHEFSREHFGDFEGVDDELCFGGSPSELINRTCEEESLVEEDGYWDDSDDSGCEEDEEDENTDKS